MSGWKKHRRRTARYTALERRRQVVDGRGQQVGYINWDNSVLMIGQQAETLLEAMIGRKLSDVISRPDLGRDVKITRAYNYVDGETWIMECSGSVILPERIALKRERDAERARVR